MVAIDWSKIPGARPVPQEDLDRLKEAIQEHVIKPSLERRRKAAERAAKWRRYMLENDPP